MSSPTNHSPRHGLNTHVGPEEQDTTEVLDAARPSSDGHAPDAPDRHDRELGEAHQDAPTTEMPPVRDTKRRTDRGLTDDQRARLATRLNPATGVWVGVALVAAGLVAIFYSWSKVAAVTNVAQQMPYLVSGGLAGLALVILGATAIDVSVRRQDSRERKYQHVQITRTLDELLQLLEADDDAEHEREQ